MHYNLDIAILKFLAQHPTRIFHPIEVSNLITDRNQKTIEPSVIKHALATLAKQGKIVATESNHYKHLHIPTRKEKDLNNYHIAPHLLAILNRNTKTAQIVQALNNKAPNSNLPND